MMGKHSQETLNNKIKNLEKENKELSQLVVLKDREIEDVKVECANQFNRISKLATSNLCGQSPEKRLNKINEVAVANFSVLMEDDVYIENDADKIIELPTTNQSER